MTGLAKALQLTDIITLGPPSAIHQCSEAGAPQPETQHVRSPFPAHPGASAVAFSIFSPENWGLVTRPPNLSQGSQRLNNAEKRKARHPSPEFQMHSICIYRESTVLRSAWYVHNLHLGTFRGPPLPYLPLKAYFPPKFVFSEQCAFGTGEGKYVQFSC